jgi:hypothetical protein
LEEEPYPETNQKSSDRTSIIGARKQKSSVFPISASFVEPRDHRKIPIAIYHWPQASDRTSWSLCFRFEQVELGGEPGARQEHLAELDEGADNEKARLDGARAVQDRGSHNRAVLDEGTRQLRRKADVPEVVTVCDQLGFLGGREPEMKSAGKRSALRSRLGLS